jgi:hypothetical protein
MSATYGMKEAGRPQNTLYREGMKMLDLPVRDAVSRWTFPQLATGNTLRAAIRFRSNSKAGLRWFLAGPPEIGIVRPRMVKSISAGSYAT